MQEISEIAHDFNRIMMLIGGIFFLAVGICLIIDKIREKEKSCSMNEHKWSRHTLGKYCLRCGLKRKDLT